MKNFCKLASLALVAAIFSNSAYAAPVNCAALNVCAKPLSVAPLVCQQYWKMNCHKPK